MTCSEFAELVTGETSICDRLARALHARRCTRCRTLAEDARMIDGALTELPKYAMPEGLERRLLSVLSEDTVAESKDRARSGRPTISRLPRIRDANSTAALRVKVTATNLSGGRPSSTKACTK